MGNEEQESIASANLAEMLQEDDANASTNAAFWEDSEVREVVSFLEAVHPDYEDTEQHRVLSYRQRTESFNAAVEEGKVSKMQHGVGWLDNSELSSEDGISRLKPYLKQNACIVAIVGPPNSGKTNTALYLADEWSKSTGGRTCTNIPIKEPWSEIFPTYETEKEVKEWMGKKDTRTMFVGDEYGTEGGSSSGKDPNKSEEFTQFARGIRKDPYNGNLILIGHRDNDLNAAMRDLVTVVIEKRDQMNKPEAYVWTDGFTNFSRGGNGWAFKMDVPKTRIEYKDHNPTFEFEERSDEEDEDSKEVIAQRMRENGVSVRKVADSVGMSVGWVNNHTE